MKKPIVFYDLETSGKSNNPDEVRILEICGIKVDPDTLEQIGDVLYYKCNNDGVPIQPDATARNGITEDDVKDCPTFHSVAKEVYDFFDGCDVGGYYSSVFDNPILYYSFIRAGLTWDYKNIKNYDISNLYKKFYGGTLSEVYQRFTGKNLDDAHTADADTKATIEVYKELRKRNGDFDNEDLAYYDDYLDIARNFKIIKNENGGKNIQVNFGKWNGKLIQEVDPSYFEWMLKQNFPPDTLHYAEKIYKSLKKER